MMIDKIDNIKQALIKEIYENGIVTPYNANLLEFFKNSKKMEIERAVNELIDDNDISAPGYNTTRNFDHFYTNFTGFLTDKAILEYENYDFENKNKFSIEILRFIQVIDETEQNTLNLSDIVNQIIKKGSKRPMDELEKILLLSIDQTCKVEKTWPAGVSHWTIMHVFIDYDTITEYGRFVLDMFVSITQMFQKSFIRSRDLLIKEYKSLDVLINNNMWKDACIKMGSILEFLLTIWLQNKKIKNIVHTKIEDPKRLKDASFADKIQFYLESAGKKYSYEIGKDTEWKITSNIIRDYRNYVHLQEYEKRINTVGPLDESILELLIPAFETIIGYF